MMIHIVGGTPVLVTILLLGSSVPSETPADYAFALAYTGFVFRMCPGWDQRTDVIPTNVLPSPETIETTWAEGGLLSKAYRAGGHAAEAAFNADSRFCDHPTRSQPDRASLLDRVLVRTPSAP